MDWKIFFTSFWMIFITEMGDKTQLANFSLVAKSKSPYVVLLGSVMAYAIVTLIAVLLGGLVCKYVPQSYIKICSGSLFLIIGVLILLGLL